MNSLLVYLVQSGFCLGALYLIYWLFLRRDTFFGINRVYLVFSVLASFLFPLLDISFLAGQEQTYMVLLEPVVITTDTIKESLISNLTVTQVLFVVYLIGASIVLVRFFYRLIQIGLLIRKYGIIQEDGLKVVYVSSDYTPFSFFNLLFVSKKITNKNQLKKIIAHEQIHIQQKHSADLILIEILAVLQWFNPFIWLYRKSLKTIHEFQADQGVLNSGYEKRDYQQLLLNQTFGIQLNTLSNNFNHSLIKTRFKMMTKTKTKKTALLKMVFVIPAAVVLTLLFSISVTDRVIAQTDTEVKKVENVQEPVKKEQKEEVIFTVVEVMPKFPGGEKARVKYMVENIKYPENARKKGITGTVFVQYVVEKDGSITGVKVLRGIGGGCDEEAMRVIKNMPNWKPGLQRGKPVRTQFNMPISFKLDGDGGKESKNNEVKDPPPPPKSK